MAKILFIVPPDDAVYGRFNSLYRQGFLSPPLSICYLAAAAEQGGHNALIADCPAERLTLPALVSIIRNFQPDLIGLSATSVDFRTGCSIMESIRKTFEKIPVIAGGPHINIFGRRALEDQQVIDFGCIGDGEKLIVELLDVIKNHDSNMLKSIPGLLFRHNGEVVEAPQRAIEKNLDCYPFPARHLLNNTLYSRAVPGHGYRRTTVIMSSRGCPYNCVYCAVKTLTGRNSIRLRSSENVVSELELIVNRFNIRHIAFNDDCLTLDKKRIYEICDGIRKKRLNMTWEGLSRADLVDKDLLKEMRSAGFVRISYGIESGNPDILQKLNKGETLDDIRRAFRITKEAGIISRGSVLIGSPYETRETIGQTFRFIRGVKGLDQVVINIMQPYPGTRVREMILAGVGGSRLIEDPERFDRLRRFGSASISVNDLSPHDLVAMQRSGFLSFYMRPVALMNNLRISGLKAFFQDGLSFMRSIAGL